MDRSKTKVRQQHRSKVWLIVASLGIAASATALVGFSSTIFSRGSLAIAARSEALPTGAIADIEFCKRLKFDDNGGVSHDVVPCDQSGTLDARGQPVPVGTMRRLDAISKSFSGR